MSGHRPGIETAAQLQKYLELQRERENGGPANATALEKLINHRRPLDPDGIMVGVSRQALDEVLAEHIKALAELSKATGAA